MDNFWDMVADLIGEHRESPFETSDQAGTGQGRGDAYGPGHVDGTGHGWGAAYGYGTGTCVGQGEGIAGGPLQQVRRRCRLRLQ